MAAAISKPLLSDLVAQTAGQLPSSHRIRPVGDRRPYLANVDGNESGAGIPLIELNGPERRKLVATIGRACESDGFFVFMVMNHGVVVPAPAGFVDGELFHLHLPESESSERLKCGYSDDPNKARALLEALSESLGLELQRSHMAVNYYCLPCPQPDYGLPVHKDPHAIITQLQRGSRCVAVNNHPEPANALAIGLSTNFNVRPHCYPLESFVDQYPPSSFRAACNVLGENIHRVIQRCVHKMGCSSPSYCLPITVNDPSPHGSETESPFSPLVILKKNDVKVEVITDEATADEDVSKFDLATIAGTLSLVVPVAINIDEHTTTWAPLWKVLCGIFMIMSLMLAFIGLFTASFRSGSRARNLSSHCARMSLVLATVVFMLLIASKLGCVGCAAGVTIVLVMLVLTILWIRCEHEI